jgi:hypothetical protein
MITFLDPQYTIVLVRILKKREKKRRRKIRWIRKRRRRRKRRGRETEERVKTGAGKEEVRSGEWERENSGKGGRRRERDNRREDL